MSLEEKMVKGDTRPQKEATNRMKSATKNHDHDMIHELSKQLDALWRYDQYIANAEEDEQLQAFWQSLKDQQEKNVQQLKHFIAKHCQKNCF